jgi:hypothetical protein
MHVRGIRLLAVLGLWAAHPGVAATLADAGATETPNPYVAQLLGLFRDGKLKQLEEMLPLARAHQPSSKADEVMLSIVEGMLSAVSGEDENASIAFGRALDLDLEAKLPMGATPRCHRIFKHERLVRLVNEGETEQATEVLAELDARPGESTKVESAQMDVLRGLLLLKQRLEAEGTSQAQAELRRLRGHLEKMAAEATDGGGALTGVELAYHRKVTGMLMVVEGLLKAEAGDDGGACEALVKALHLNPTAKLPRFASSQARLIFGHAMAESVQRPSAQLPGEVQKAWSGSRDDLDQVEELLEEAGGRRELGPVDKDHLRVLEGLLAVLRRLASAAEARKADQAKGLLEAEGLLQQEEDRLARTSAGALNETEARQQLILKSLLAIAKGLIKLESGDVKQTKMAFAEAWELDPSARLPTVHASEVRRSRVRREFITAKPDPVVDCQLASQLEYLVGVGNYRWTEDCLAKALARRNQSKLDLERLALFKDLLGLIGGLEDAGAGGRARWARDDEAKARQLESRLSGLAWDTRKAAEAEEQRRFKALLQVVRGMIQAESCKVAQANATFAEALKLHSRAVLPAVATARTRLLFLTMKKELAGGRLPR